MHLLTLRRHSHLSENSSHFSAQRCSTFSSCKLCISKQYSKESFFIQTLRKLRVTPAEVRPLYVFSKGRDRTREEVAGAAHACRECRAEIRTERAM